MSMNLLYLGILQPISRSIISDCIVVEVHSSVSVIEAVFVLKDHRYSLSAIGRKAIGRGPRRRKFLVKQRGPSQEQLEAKLMKLIFGEGDE